MNQNIGIVHIGVGNFHRAHQAYYLDKLMKLEGQTNWGICGVSLMQGDENVIKSLREQDCKYTLTICGRDGINNTVIVNSIRELIWGVEDPELVFEKIANKDIKIISLTITEGGYNLDKQTDEFIFNEPKIQHDLNNTSNPQTVFGFVAEGLRRRMKNQNGPITILSCDNLQHNGNTTRKAFLAFMDAQDKELAKWVMSNVSFPNSMVDRITPATTNDDIVRLNTNKDFYDKVPVYCEDYIQWVIEDNFIAGRPPLEKVGVEFTDDVTVYEQMKINLLNASHTLLSYLSFLKGYRKVDHALGDKSIVKYIKEFMDFDMSPYVATPPNTNLAAYKQILIERFANKSVSDQISRLCANGISKFPIYIMPNLVQMIRDKKPLQRLGFLFACYRHYLKYQQDENGVAFVISEPFLTEEDKQLIDSDDIFDFLHVSAFKSVDLFNQDEFIKVYSNQTEMILQHGISKALDLIIA